MQLSRKNILISLLALVGFVVCLFIFLHPQGKIEFTIAPSEGILTLNSKKQTIHHKDTISLSPGTYSISLSRDGFSTEEKTITVKNHETSHAIIALTPLTDDAKKIFDVSTDAHTIAQQYEQQNFNDLLTSLPAAGIGYSLNSCSSLKEPQSNKKIICVSIETPSAKDAALQTLRQAGINPDAHEILFGSDNVKQVINTESYKIEYHSNLKTAKPALYITPLLIDYAASTSDSITQLEALRQTALSTLKQSGYDPKNYDILYTNLHLMNYNPIVAEEADHKEVPVH